MLRLVGCIKFFWARAKKDKFSFLQVMKYMGQTGKKLGVGYNLLLILLKLFISLLIVFILRSCLYCLPCWKEYMRFRWTLFITDSICMSHESFVYFWFGPINFKNNKRYPFQHPSNKAYFTDICIGLFIYDTQHFYRSNSLSLSHWLNVSLTGSLIIKRKIRYSFLICA